MTYFEVRGDRTDMDTDLGDKVISEIGEGVMTFPTPDRMEVYYLDSDRVVQYANRHPKELSVASASFDNTAVVATPRQWLDFLTKHVHQPGWLQGPMVYVRKR